jgi:hypothetical protein
VVTRRVDRVLSISEVRPNLVGKKLKLRVFYPFFGVLFLMFVMLAQDLLKKNKVGLGFTDRFSNSPKYKLTVPGRESLVNVVGENA